LPLDREISPSRKVSPSREKTDVPLDSSGEYIPTSHGASSFLPHKLIRSGSDSSITSQRTNQATSAARKSRNVPSASTARKLLHAPTDNQFGYFAVFDGHGGDKASIFLKENYHRYFLNQKDDIKAGKYPDALAKAFLKVDKTFLKTCRKEVRSGQPKFWITSHRSS
jgi:hypothetical protein